MHFHYKKAITLMFLWEIQRRGSSWQNRKYGRFRKDNKITVMMVHTVLKTGLTNGAVILLPLSPVTLTHKNTQR